MEMFSRKALNRQFYETEGYSVQIRLAKSDKEIGFIAACNKFIGQRDFFSSRPAIVETFNFQFLSLTSSNLGCTRCKISSKLNSCSLARAFIFAFPLTLAPSGVYLKVRPATFGSSFIFSLSSFNTTLSYPNRGTACRGVQAGGRRPCS